MNNLNIKPRPMLILMACVMVTFVLVRIRPGYFTDVQFLAGILFLEALAAVVWKYAQRFFPVLMLVFLLAGTNAPMQGIWSALRWVVLAAGAISGVAVYLKDYPLVLQPFHWTAFACVATAAISAEVSSFPKQPLLKSLSLFLLCLYGAFGARLPLMEQKEKFFWKLLLVCEAMIYFAAVEYFVLHRAFFGNPNSLGVVMGVAMIPLMLWGISVSEKLWDKKRRMFALLLAMALLLTSYSRASLVAASVTCAMFCLTMRRYRMLATGAAIALVMATAVATLVPLPNSHDASTDLSSRFIYKGDRQKGAMASRKPVWDSSITSIKMHPWFGTGFGTALSNYESNTGYVGNFGSNAMTSREHGNSYLAILEGVGLLGVVPFVCLIALMAGNVLRVLRNLWKTRDPFSTAVPLSLVLLAGLVHAMFEDWLFAVGYYTCVFFWSFSFMLVDFVPEGSPAMAAEKPFLSPELREDAMVFSGY